MSSHVSEQTVEYEVFRGPKGGELTKIAQVAEPEYIDSNITELETYDYGVRFILVESGITGSMSRITQQLRPTLSLIFDTNDHMMGLTVI